MPEGWDWDESLFAGSSVFYDRGRIPYPPGLRDAFADAANLRGSPRLIDVGCGPGTVALRLADLFAGVVGVDADRGMIEEATRLAAKRDLANARWLRLRAEELPAGLGTFRYATFARSFHWMDPRAGGRPGVRHAGARWRLRSHWRAGDRDSSPRAAASASVATGG